MCKGDILRNHDSTCQTEPRNERKDGHNSKLTKRDRWTIKKIVTESHKGSASTMTTELIQHHKVYDVTKS